MNISQRFWRFRWHGLILTWCISMVGWILVAMQPNMYEATAEVYARSNAFLVARRIKSESSSQTFTILDMVRQSLLDRQQIDRVLQAAGSPRMSMPGSDKGSVADRLLGRIEISTAAKWEDLFRISLVDSDRRKALSVVEAVVTVFSELAIDDPGMDEESVTDEAGSKIAPAFRIADPPAVGRLPVGPSRLMWTTLMLAAGLAAGGCLAYWLSLRRPVFDNVGAISAIGGLPVVGVVRHAWMDNAKAQRRRDSLMFGIATAALMLCFAIALMIQQFIASYSAN